MVSGFGRFVEQTKQKGNCSGNDRGFQPTSNARNEKMWAESTKFARRLKACQKHVKKLQGVAEGALNSTDRVTTKPAPRVFDHVDNTVPLTQTQAKAVADVPIPPTSASAMSESDYQGAPESTTGHTEVLDSPVFTRNLTQQLHQQAIMPIAEWLKEYKLASAPVKNLEKLRLDLDACRRARLTWEVKKVKQQNQKDHVDSAVTNKFNMKETNLDAARFAYTQQEGAVYKLLTKLNKDAAQLQSHLASVIRLDDHQTFSANNSPMATPPMTPGPGSVQDFATDSSKNIFKEDHLTNLTIQPGRLDEREGPIHESTPHVGKPVLDSIPQHDVAKPAPLPISTPEATQKPLTPLRKEIDSAQASPVVSPKTMPKTVNNDFVQEPAKVHAA